MNERAFDLNVSKLSIFVKLRGILFHNQGKIDHILTIISLLLERLCRLGFNSFLLRSMLGERILIWTFRAIKAVTYFVVRRSSFVVRRSCTFSASFWHLVVWLWKRRTKKGFSTRIKATLRFSTAGKSWEITAFYHMASEIKPVGGLTTK